MVPITIFLGLEEAFAAVDFTEVIYLQYISHILIEINNFNIIFSPLWLVAGVFQI